MAVTEAVKHDLYNHLQETMGDDRATTLMNLLSPAGWADVATKQDLEHLRESLRNEVTATFERSLRTHTIATFAANAVFVGVAVTLARVT